MQHYLYKKRIFQFFSQKLPQIHKPSVVTKRSIQQFGNIFTIITIPSEFSQSTNVKASILLTEMGKQNKTV